jgi:hypothetical protein
LELLLGWQAEPARLRAGADDEGFAQIDIAGITNGAERAAAEVDLGDGVGDELGADMAGLALHLLHQPGTLDHVGEAGIILDIGRDGHLAAGGHALDQDRLQAGARGIDGGGIAGRAGADNQNFCANLPWRCCHGRESKAMRFKQVSNIRWGAAWHKLMPASHGRPGSIGIPWRKNVARVI